MLDTSARADASEAKAYRMKQIELAETNFQVVLDKLMPKLVRPLWMIYNFIVDTVYSMGHRIGKDAFIKQQRAIIGRIDSRPQLAKISCPNLVLCGPDLITPVGVHEEMATAIPGSQLEVIEECAHFSVMGQPQLVSEAVRVWLQRIRQSLRKTEVFCRSRRHAVFTASATPPHIYMRRG